MLRLRFGHQGIPKTVAVMTEDAFGVVCVGALDL